MKKSLLFSLLIIFTFYARTQGLSGNYSIDANKPNGGGNYQSFSLLAEDLNNVGVSSAVYVSVAAGTYYDSLHLGHIPGSSQINTITIDGIDSSRVKLMYQKKHFKEDKNAVVILDSTSHFNIKNMWIENMDSVSGKAIIISNAANHNSISNTTLVVNPKFKSDGSSDGDFHNILFLSRLKDSTGISYNSIMNNTLLAGQIGILIQARQKVLNLNNKIYNNVIRSMNKGLTLNMQDSLEIYSNNISPHSLSIMQNGFFTLIDIQNSKFIDIQKNYLIKGRVSLSGSYKDSSLRPKTTFVNNMIIGNLQFYYPDTTSIYHNSINSNFFSSPEAALRIIEFTKANSLDIRNNIFSSSTEALFLANFHNEWLNAFSKLNHNIYHNNGEYLFTIVKNGSLQHYGNLKEFNSLFPQFNANSMEVAPNFLSENDLHLKASFAFARGDNSIGIKEDIDGDIRPLSGNVSIGADEFETFKLNYRILQLNNAFICEGNNSLSINVANLGSDTIHQIQLNYQINGILDSVLSNRPILPSDTQNIALKNIPFYRDSIYQLLIVSKNPNNMLDDYPKDDSLNVLLKTALTGKYQIDSSLQTAGTNFQSFEDMAEALRKYGMCGNVNVDVVEASGPYSNQLILHNILGSGADAILRINGKGEQLKHITQADSERGSVSILNSSYITIDSLHIYTDGSNTYSAAGIHIQNNSHHIEIKNCEIELYKVQGLMLAGLKSSGGIIVDNSPDNWPFSSPSNAHHLQMINNKIHSTAQNEKNHGIYFEYDSTYFPFHSFSSKNIISDNSIINTSNGIYCIYQDSMEISNNKLELNSKIESEHAIEFIGNNSIINANNIQGSSISEALIAGGVNNYVSNNLIHDLGYNSVALTGYGKSYFYNNTVSMMNKTFDYYRCIGLNIGENASFINNLVSMSGVPTMIGIYLEKDVSNFYSNYNNIFLEDSTSFAYFGAQIDPSKTQLLKFKELSTWQKVYGQDSNSLTLNPEFEEAENDNFKPQSKDLDNKGLALPYLQFDYYGITRGAKPDIGAIEFEKVVGINENQLSIFKLFPNPSSGIFYLLQSKEVKANCQLSLIDVNGRLLFEKEMNSSGYQLERLDFSGFPKGMYFLKILTAQGESVEKLVIK